VKVNPLHDESKFTPAELQEKQMWDRRCDDVNRSLDNLSYEFNQLMPDHDWLKIISTAILD
jgi:hypothetical protein